MSRPARATSGRATNAKKLTDVQRRVLLNVFLGRHAGHGFASGRYASQAAHQATGAVLRKGLLVLNEDPTADPAYKLTDIGYQLLVAAGEVTIEAAYDRLSEETVTEIQRALRDRRVSPFKVLRDALKQADELLFTEAKRLLSKKAKNNPPEGA